MVKSREARTLIQDLEETFASLNAVNLRLNPEKCVFGVPSGKLLGFLVSHRGIEANPKKVKEVEDISPAKDPQRNAEAHGARDRARALHLQVGGTSAALLLANEEKGAL